MSQNDQAERKSGQAFGFHQLRQACEISSLRQEITRLLGGTAELQILIENEVERVRQRLGALDAAESQNPARLSPLLSDAMAALIEIRDASRRLETAMARRTPDPRPPAPAADLIEQTLRRPFTERQPPAPALLPRTEPACQPPPAPPPEPRPHREPRLPPQQAPAPCHAAPPPPARPPASSAKVMNWLAPSNR
ncbi:MAG: hypothetical protein WCO00_01445 [Rhodospirillaceae bacterium]